MPQIFVITGVQAAGKSTVAALLARRYPRAVHVAGDDIRAMVVSGRADMTPQASDEAVRQLLLRYQATVAVAGAYYEAGFNVVLEDVIIGEMLERFLALLPWPRVHLIVLNPDEREIVRREEERSKIAYDATWSVGNLRRILEEETPRHGRWLDSSGQTPDETVTDILANLDSSAVNPDVVAR
jgi:predicted kinase